MIGLPWDIVLFVFHPVAVPRNVARCEDLTVTRGVNRVKVVILLPIPGIELRDLLIALAEESLVCREGSRAIIRGIGLVVKHKASLVVALRRHDATVRGLMVRDDRANSVEPLPDKLIEFWACV